jgi:hypothetical protein
MTLLLAAMSAAVAAAPGATEILAGADAYRNFRDQSFTFDLVLRSQSPGKDEKVFGLEVEIKDSHTSLVKYVAPVSERGKAMLMAGNNLWFQAPHNRKPIRITPQQRLLGEASNGDVASTDFSGDYDPELIGGEQVDGIDCYKLRLTAKEGSPAAYKSLLLWVRKDGFAPVKAEFFAPSGKPLKTARYRRYEPVEAAGGKLQLTEIEIVNALNEQQRTVMEYSNFAIRDLPDAHFNPRYLSRLR